MLAISHHPITKAAAPAVLLMRPHHWVKNLFLFLPLFFSGEALHINKLLATTAGMLSFNFITSAVYILNDLTDSKTDKLHPLKRHRPLASGAISRTSSVLLLFLCFLLGMVASAFINTKFLLISIGYLLLNLLYSFGFKNISILDVILLAIGFVLRVKAGGVITGIYVSQWLVIMVFLLAIFMAVAKRRDDIALKLEPGVNVRKLIGNYTIDFLNLALILVSSVIIITYLLYTTSPEITSRWKVSHLYYTTLFVFAGILRYLQIALIEQNANSPTKLLYRDTFLQLTLMGWIMSYYFIIYMHDLSFL